MPAGYVVDAGPNWIHGTSDNPILDIAKQTNTPVGTWDTDTYLFDDKGDAVPLAEAEYYSTMMWNIIEGAFRHSNQNCTSISPNESLWDFFQVEVAKRVPETEADFVRKREMVFHTAESWGAFVGSHIFGQSLKYFWLEECIEGGRSIPMVIAPLELGLLTRRRESFLCGIVQEDPGAHCCPSCRQCKHTAQHNR